MAINNVSWSTGDKVTSAKLTAMVQDEVNTTDDIHAQYSQYGYPSADADHRFMVYFAYQRSSGNTINGRYTIYKSNIPVTGPTVSVFSPDNFVDSPIATEILIRKKYGCSTLTIAYTDSITDSVLYITLKTYTGAYTYSAGVQLDNTNFLRSQDPEDSADHNRTITVDIAAIPTNQIIRIYPYAMIDTLALSGDATQEHYIKLNNLTIVQS